ncbi:YcxB family protein [Gracilibacillus timonensis]|uniref:YcxB family protein n=1 Tax=Gracilibacillus timonensis TaxID=1816696 RepID=UPI0008257C6F|nr:YcxB family protein [Gracilibacillus timonensis]
MDNNEELEVTAEGALTYDEFKKYNMYHQRKLLIGFFIFASIIGIYPFTATDHLPLIIFIIFSLLLAVLATKILSRIFKKGAYKEFHSDRLASKEMTYTMKQEGINYQVGRSHVFVEWGNIVKGAEHKEMFCLYISSIKALVLPKRYFASDEDIMVFKQLISSNTDKVRLED